MPMHRIYTASGLYTPAEKATMAKNITALYTNVMPAFYVVVLFIDLAEDSYFIGGEQNNKFVRINVQHLARHFSSDEVKIKFMHMYEQAVKPFTADKGLDWEINIDEADPITWHENGMSPPAPKSKGEELWKQTNKAVPFEGPSFSDHELTYHKA
ncbi:4-oxalocrotonate tautomerase [Ceratobasidium sp. AG-Ba]|nr:4-oxalocrotonate tautomerase [Ceratobasidium sp. AG-Ba]